MARIRNGNFNSNIAFGYFKRALKYYTYETFPIDHKLVIGNLINSYFEFAIYSLDYRLEGEKLIKYLINLESKSGKRLKVNSLMQAKGLMMAGNWFRSSSDVPNLILPREFLNLRLNNAVKCYLESLNFFKVELYPKDYAIVKNNLGISYIELARLSQDLNLIDKAIEALSDSRSVRSSNTNSFEYGQTLLNLGQAYEMKGRIIDISRKIPLFKLAIRTLIEASNILTISTYPLEYFKIQFSLANCYHFLGDIESKEENLINEINSLKEALKIKNTDEIANIRLKLAQSTQSAMENSLGK